ncbi:MAG TPA: hypothetical protein VIC62_20060, partial [Nakamurella sp.]
GFGFLTAVVDPRFGVAAPFLSDVPDRAAARRAAARAEPGEAGVVNAESAADSAPDSSVPSVSSGSFEAASAESAAGGDLDSDVDLDFD